MSDEPNGPAGGRQRLEILEAQLNHLAVRFGLGEISPSTYRLVRDRLADERARIEVSLAPGEYDV